MKFTKYGISLVLLKEKDIELVRQWRNDPSVANFHAFREYITPEMQKEWFKSIDNPLNMYFIIEYQGEKIGVLSLKNADLEKHTAESGIFLPEGKYRNTYIPALLSVMTMELGLRLFDWDRGYAHVLRTNKPAKSLIASLGYELCPGQESEENQLYYITQENFDKKARKVLNAMKVITGEDAPMTLTIDADEFDNKVIKEWLAIGHQSKQIIRSEETPESKIYYFA